LRNQIFTTNVSLHKSTTPFSSVRAFCTTWPVRIDARESKSAASKPVEFSRCGDCSLIDYTIFQKPMLSAWCPWPVRIDLRIKKSVVTIVDM
jgi:hypothetical protein